MQDYYPPIQRVTTLSMDFRTYLQQKIQDEDWIWEVTEKYGLNEHYPRYAKTVIFIQVRNEWLRL